MIQLLKRTLLISLVFFASKLLLAQNEGNIWYFGENAGIDFNSGSPVPLSNGQLNTFEGCASISDANGSLLFYTDGTVVYNANHATMPNGTALAGNPSSTQSGIIVQDPGASNLYYIFTVEGFGSGLSYSVVDMNLQGGLGDVSILNSAITNNTTEKVTAVQHANGTDYWILTLMSAGVTTNPGYHAYLLSSTGVNLTPVVTNLGFPDAVGCIKSNIQGDKIAVANSNNSGNELQIYDFDNATGILSNELSIDLSAAYGVEFSPNGNLLYVSCWSTSANILQYNLQAGTGSLTDVINSQVDLSDPDQTSTCGTLQLGPDLKIYQAIGYSTDLGVINDPDVLGSGCNYNSAGFALGGPISTYGLPVFFNSIYSEPPAFNYTICQGDSIYLYDPSFQNHNWYVSTSPSTIFSTDTAITVAPNNDISYLLIDGTDTTIFNITVSPSFTVDLGPDKTLCNTDSVLLTNLTIIPGTNVSYLWQNNTTNDTLYTDLAGLYWLEVSNGGCTARDTIFVNNFSGVDILPNNPICFGTPTGSIVANVVGGGTGNSFIFTDDQGNVINAAGTNVANNLSAGTYFLEVVGPDGCGDPTPITLVDPPEIQITLSLTSPACHGEAGGSATVANLINYQGDFEDINYVWTPNPQNNNGLLTDFIFDLVAGEYSIEIIDDFGCINSQVFYITEPDPLEAVITDNIPTFCRTAGFQSGNGVLAAEVPAATAGTPPLSFNWLNLADDQSANTSTVVMRSPGQVVLTITDANSCTYVDTVQLDSLNPIADFIIESDQFDIPNVYEGTELLTIDVTNLSQNFAQAINPNSDTIFQLNLNTNGPNGGNWFFSYDLDEKIDTTYEGEAVYQVCLITKNYNDCADTLCQDVTVFAFPELIAPNVFTPGSSPNSHFYFPARGIAEFECTVFNRYGVVVYEFNSIADQWDGTNYKSGGESSDGVYSYVYKATSTNGTPFQGEGQVTLVRVK